MIRTALLFAAVLLAAAAFHASDARAEDRQIRAVAFD
jgi:hypothetical protein